MFKRLILLLPILILLCGCSATEPNEKYLVSAIGVTKRGEYTQLYYKITDIASSDKVGEQGVKTLSASGKSMLSAAENINLGSELDVSLTHCEILVLSPTADKNLTDEVFSFCREKEMPLKLKLAVSEEVEELFSPDNTLSGEKLNGMLRVVAKNYGFGGHTALFEIETAIKTNNGNFALPRFSKPDDAFVITGLAVYENGRFSRPIGIYESMKYVKDNKI